MNKQALLLIDLQNDFCPGGALAVPEGDRTIPVANQLIHWFTSRHNPVLASKDWHPACHSSFASQQGCPPFTRKVLHGLTQTLWPDHCIQHSYGAGLHPALAQQAIDAVFTKGEDPQADSYSAFFDNGHVKQTQLDSWLKQRNITELVMMGLATDYCVKFTVLDALQLGYRVTVIGDGCRGVNLAADDSEQALQQMQTAGAAVCCLAEWFLHGQ